MLGSAAADDRLVAATLAAVSQRGGIEWLWAHRTGLLAGAFWPQPCSLWHAVGVAEGFGDSFGGMNPVLLRENV